MIVLYLIATLIVQVLIGAVIGAVILRLATHFWNRITGNQPAPPPRPTAPEPTGPVLPRSKSDNPYQAPTDQQPKVVAETAGLEIPRFGKAFVICLIVNGINYLIGIASTILINVYWSRIIDFSMVGISMLAGRFLIAVLLLALIVQGFYPTSFSRAAAVAGLSAALSLIFVSVIAIFVLLPLIAFR